MRAKLIHELRLEIDCEGKIGPLKSKIELCHFNVEKALKKASGLGCVKWHRRRRSQNEMESCKVAELAILETNVNQPKCCRCQKQRCFFVHPPELICRFSQPITFSTAPGGARRDRERGKDSLTHYVFLSLSPGEHRVVRVYIHTYFLSGKSGEGTS